MSSADKDRRRAWRIPVLEELPVRMLSSPMPVMVRDISATGFGLATTQPIPVGLSQRFQFRFVEDESPVQFDATCVRCESVLVSDLPIYLAGFEFGPLERDVYTALIAFIEKIAASAPMGPV